MSQEKYSELPINKIAMATHVGFEEIGGIRVQIFIQYDPDAFDVTEVYSDEDETIRVHGIVVQSGDEMPHTWLDENEIELNEAGREIWEEAP